MHNTKIDREYYQRRLHQRFHTLKMQDEIKISAEEFCQDNMSYNSFSDSSDRASGNESNDEPE